MKPKKYAIISIVFIFIFTLNSFEFSVPLLISAQAQDSILELLKSIAVIEQKVMVPMRDGVRLATDIYRPKTDKPVPVILSRTPYNFNPWRNGELTTRNYQTAFRNVRRGYAYVVQNERGRYYSEGKWDILGPPTTDGYDAIQWLAEQPWSNGKVGLIGCSSTAEWQMAVAALDPPGLAAVVPMGFCAGIGRVGEFYEQGNWYRGGVHQMLMTAWLYDYGFIQTFKNRPRSECPWLIGQTEVDTDAFIFEKESSFCALCGPVFLLFRDAASFLPLQAKAPRRSLSLGMAQFQLPFSNLLSAEIAVEKSGSIFRAFL